MILYRDAAADAGLCGRPAARQPPKVSSGAERRAAPRPVAALCRPRCCLRRRGRWRPSPRSRRSPAAWSTRPACSTPDAEARLTGELAAHEQATGDQVVVATVRSLQGRRDRGLRQPAVPPLADRPGGAEQRRPVPRRSERAQGADRGRLRARGRHHRRRLQHHRPVPDPAPLPRRRPAGRRRGRRARHPRTDPAGRGRAAPGRRLEPTPRHSRDPSHLAGWSSSS